MGQRCGVKKGILVSQPERDYLVLWGDPLPAGKGMIPDSILKGGYQIPMHTKTSFRPRKGNDDSLVMWKFQCTVSTVRRHNFIPHNSNTGAYSPSLCKNKEPYSKLHVVYHCTLCSSASQSSWSPSIDETGSPRLKMPLPPPSTPEDGHCVQELYTDSHHQHNSKSLIPLSVDNDRGRDARALNDGRSPINKGIREDRWHHVHPKVPGYRRHSVVANGLEMKSDGQHSVRDPRQAGYSRASVRVGYPHSHRVMKEHTYSKRYQEGCEHPRFCRVGACSDLSPQLLTPVSSSTASKTGGGKRSASSNAPPTSGGSTTTSTAEGPAQQEPIANTPVTAAGADQKTVAGIMKTRSNSTVNECTIHPSSRSAPTNDSGSDASVTPSSPPQTGKGVESMKEPVKKDSNTIQHKGKSPMEGEPKETRVWGEDEEKKSSVSSDPAMCSLDGFHLDLDPEPTSSSNSNSTCCSESEEMAEEKAGDSDMDVEADSEEGDRTMEAEPGSDDLAKKMSTDDNQQWAVTSPEPGKMRFSRLDNIDRSPESERVHLKQITSNRIQLRNGRVLPPSSLAFLAASPKLVSPPQRSPPQLDGNKNHPPSMASSSPGPGQLRRSKRLAEVMEEGSQSKEINGESGGGHDSILDPSFEIQLSDEPVESSDESEFDLPDFDLVPIKRSPPGSPQHTPPTETRSVRGRKGRGRGRGARRGGKRGGAHSYTRSEGMSDFYLSPCSGYTGVCVCWF